MAKGGDKAPEVLVAPESGLSLVKVRKSQGVSGIGDEMLDLLLKISSLMLEKLNQALFSSDCGSTMVGMVGKAAGECCVEGEKLKESKSANTSLESMAKGEGSSGLSSNIVEVDEGDREQVEWWQSQNNRNKTLRKQNT